MVGQDVKYGQNTTTETAQDHQEHQLGLTLPQHHHGEGGEGPQQTSGWLLLTFSVFVFLQSEV